MGIKNLNKYLNLKCGKHIYEIHLSDLSNKKIAVDTSIYMYRFKKDNMLIEGFFQMISLFRHYDIIPIFIFDGKAPIEKINTIKSRYQNKLYLIEECNKLNEEIKKLEKENKDTLLLKNELILKTKECIYITPEDVRNVKELIYLCGMNYITACGEADKLCAYLTVYNYVYACLSEDMDLFVYGCNYILRYISLLKETVILYNFKEILNELGLKQREFQEICILSGTDYNKSTCVDINNNMFNIDIYKAAKLFLQYKNEVFPSSVSIQTQSLNKNNNIYNNKNNNIYNNICIGDDLDFYEWLYENNIITENQYIEYNNILIIFSIEDYKDNIKINNKAKTFENKEIHIELLQRYLKEYGYIFINT